MYVFRRQKPRVVKVFDWSANMAYAVGLIATDGSLSSNGKNIIFTSKDIELITNIKLILKLGGQIGITKNKHSEAYRIQFSSVQLFDWLMSLGLTPNKSLTIGNLQIPDEYFIDFLRGHLDGDGSITTYTDRYNTSKNPKYIYERIWLRFISGSESHITWLRSMIMKLYNVNGRIHTTKANAIGNNMHILKYGKKDSLRLLSLIYYSEDLLCLTRKRIIYEKFKRNEKNSTPSHPRPYSNWQE